jgi:hypothetical protein
MTAQFDGILVVEAVPGKLPFYRPCPWRLDSRSSRRVAVDPTLQFGGADRWRTLAIERLYHIYKYTL